MQLTQRARILKSSAPIHIIGGVEYKGQQPIYAPIFDPITNQLTGHRKISKGIPFVRV